ncbi:MAG: SBBP repeat-containing protein, partial [Acidobacteria bacterium]|nr:SBBP repeat-containing protein [Acidobacteriota bacterium]
MSPGADPSLIQLAFEGSETIRIDADGELVLGTGVGEIRHRKPLIYQLTGENRRLTQGRYVIQRDKRVQFQVESYDRSRTLVIDPVLSYSSPFGGSALDFASGITTDSEGNIYLAGATLSTDFPTTAGSLRTTGVQGADDVFVR